MKAQQRAFRVGDIVRLPHGGGIYGELAIVRVHTPGGINVNTEKYDLAYEAADLTYAGRIALGKTYTHEGNRVRDCFYVDTADKWVGVTVCIRADDATSDIDDFTTQWHAFSLLAVDGIIV